MTLQQSASTAVKNSHWEDMIGEWEALEEKAIQQASSCGGCQRQQAQRGSTGTQRNSWQLLWQDEAWICTAVSDPVSSVKTPPMAGQSCSNNANNAAAKFQVFPKFILSILMESPGLEPVSVVSIVHFHQSIFFCFSSSGLQGGGWSLSQLSEGKRCTVAGIMQR